MNKHNGTLKTIFLTAVENYKKKDFKTAEIYCYKILSIDPNHFESISMLATIAAINRDFSKAKELLHKAIEIQPKNISAIHNLATANTELGELQEAKKFYQKVLEIDPNHVNANYNLGLVFYKLKELIKAKNYLKKTVTIQNNYALAFFSLANVHFDLKEHDHAVACYQKAIEIKSDFVSAHNNLGLVFRELNDFENSISSYKKAIQIQPNYPSAYQNLAQAYKETGKFEKAVESHKMAIKFEPNNLVHYHFLTELKKDFLDSVLKEKILKILENKNNSKINLAYGNFILAKYERKNKNYKKEFDYLVKGHQDFYNANKKKFDLGIKYSFNDILQISNEAKLNKASKKNEIKIKPIFIIGVPRCGSTLLEKIIGSGDQLVPLGEETSVLENYINNKILEKKSLNLGSDTEVRNELYHIYKMRGLISEKGKFVFTDKSLNNFFYLNLIKEIFPDAKVINCRRNILSSILSIFQNNLTDLAWAHDLENIFKYFNNYFNITEIYKKENSYNIYDLEFEKLINEPEIESKKLMEFCGLSWNKKCLEFYKRKDLISKTASNIQIRKAIYKHEANRYLPYKGFLDKFGKNYSWYN